MLRAKYIEKMGTGIKEMRRLVRRAKLNPIKFNFTNFTTVTFYRPPHPGGRYVKSPEVIAMDTLSGMLIEKTGIHRKNIDRVLQILSQVENKTFSKNSFSIKYNIPLRTLTRDIKTLKKQKLISFEGSKRKGRYKITEKYRALKNLSITKSGGLSK